MKFCSLTITAFMMICSFRVGAGETLEQKLANLKLEERQAQVMIEKLQRRGRMDQDEATRARREIASVKEEDVEQIRHDALEDLKNTKSFVNK